ncbi:MAG: hypothetical protein OXT09_03935 [Myxococcales bacterium]|nr:hypothetical protein [Myxococcales bacterium]
MPTTTAERCLWITCLLAGALLASPLHAQQLECESDADCAEGEECIIEEAVSVPGCDPGAGPCDDTPRVEVYSHCDQAPLRCESDDDCPTGLICDLENPEDACAVSSDGEVFCPEPSESIGGACTFELVQCSSDAECGANEECVALGGSEECSDGGPVSCVPGEECVVEEPVCEVVEELFACFPTFMPCVADEECPNGWGCLAFAEVDDEAPPFWDVGDATGACLPEGILLAARDQADIGRSDGPSIGDPAIAESGSADSAASGSSDTDEAGSATPQGSGSGLCAVAGHAPTGELAWLVLALVCLRRRRSQ